MPSSLEVTRVLIQEGKLEGESPHYLSFRGKAALRGVSLYCLAEATAPERGGLCQWALQTLERHLARGRGSLTAAMKVALQGCHRELLEANQDQETEGRVGLGLTCLGLRGQEAYLAWAGPVFISLREGQRFRQLAPPKEGPTALVGLTPGDLHVSQARQVLQGGDALLVAASSLHRFVSSEGALAILGAQPREAARKLYLLTQGEPTFAALLVTAPSSR